LSKITKVDPENLNNITTMKKEIRIDPIKTFPDINFRACRKKDTDNPFFNDGRFFFFSSGRAAIHLAAKALVRSKPLVVYLPAFHCGVEVEAFVRAGCRVRFYAIDERLNVKLPERMEEIEEGSIFFIIHYFGFPQHLESITVFCEKHKMILMEDCAHSLYSCYQGEFLGRIGRVSVFSPRKTLALPNGGGLLINDPTLPNPERGRKQFTPTLYKSTFRSICDFEVKRGGIGGQVGNIFIRGFNRLRKTEIHEEIVNTDGCISYYDDSRFAYDLGMSLISYLFIEPMPYQEIVTRRRENYILLASLLEKNTKFHPVFPELPEGVSPLCFPVWVDNSDRWMSILEDNAIEPFVFGRQSHKLLDKELVNKVEKLKTNIIGLPVHQYLDMKDIIELSNRIEKMAWYGK
jgi:dTDP-4-amino-4,6-dideoxygalactose transaminase